MQRGCDRSIGITRTVQGHDHASLRVPLPECEMLSATGSIKRWRQQTPAMAAGLTDHIWSLREVLRYRVPPWPQPRVE